MNSQLLCLIDSHHRSLFTHLGEEVRFLNSVAELLAHSGCEVVILAQSLVQKTTDLLPDLRQWGRQQKNPAFILWHDSDEPITEVSPFAILGADFSQTELAQLILAAREKKRWEAQQEQLGQLLAEQSANLKNFQAELEARVAKRSAHLEASRRKVTENYALARILRRAAILVHQSQNIPEIEAHLSTLVPELVPGTFVKIKFSGSEFSPKLGKSHRQVPLWIDGQAFGDLLLIGDVEKELFAQNLLRQLGEIISPAILRLNRLAQREEIAHHWSSTFDAITEPMIVVDRGYRLLNANRAARKHPENERYCFQTLFARDEPCTNCTLGQRFELKHNQLDLQITSHRVWDANNKELFVNHYQDITRRKQIESRLAQSGKLTDLGVVSSSIAHELNNPLAGMLSFVQLMKMDVPADQAEMLTELQEIEKAIFRCRDIVGHLLRFSRVNGKSLEKIDLISAWMGLRQLIELKARSKKLRLTMPDLNDDLAGVVVPGDVLFTLEALVQSSLQQLELEFGADLAMAELSLNLAWASQNKDKLHFCLRDNGRDEHREQDLDSIVAHRFASQLGAKAHLQITTEKSGLEANFFYLVAHR